MFKTNEVLQLVTDGVESIDGVMTDKPDQDGNYDLYQVEVEHTGPNTIIADFSTINNRGENHDKYMIIVRAIE